MTNSHHKICKTPEDLVEFKRRKAEHAKRYRERHPERVKAQFERWQAENLERRRQYYRDYYADNREMRAEDARQRRAADPEAHRARTRAWAKRNPDAVRAIQARRRARFAGAEGSYTSEDVQRLYAAQRGRCAYCKLRMRNGFQVDHIVALSKGGSNHPRNLQILCIGCNSSKKDKDPIEFAQSRGLLV